MTDMDAILRRELGPRQPPTNRLIASETTVAFSDMANRKRRRQFASQVGAARRLLDWSQADLSHHAGVNLRTVQRLEGAQEMPAESTFVGVCAALAAAGIKFIGDNKGAIGVLLTGRYNAPLAEGLNAHSQKKSLDLARPESVDSRY
jgi:hypothetical protein